MRLGQLNEKIFSAMQDLTVKNGNEFVGDANDLNLLLSTGESFLEVYLNYFEPYMVPVASYAVDVGKLYELRAETNDLERAQHWYEFAIKFWTDRGENDCAKIIEDESRASAIQWQPGSYLNVRKTTEEVD